MMLSGSIGLLCKHSVRSRALGNDPVAIVFAVRQCRDEREMRGLPSIAVHGLVPNDARSLLESTVVGPLDEQVRDRIVAETRGKPLMLLELARRLAPEELAGGFGSPDGLDLSARLEERFRRQLQPLPAATRRVSLVAAAEPVADPVLLRNAAARLGVLVDDAAPAAVAGIVDLDDSVRFHHPLARSAVYRAATPDERRSAHHALAEVTDPKVDPDRRAWHRAQATAGLDEATASELEGAVDRARARGGLVAAAAFRGRRRDVDSRPGPPGRRRLRPQTASTWPARRRRPSSYWASCWRDRSMSSVGGPGRAATGSLTLGRGRGRDSLPLLLAAAKGLEPLDFALSARPTAARSNAALVAGRMAGREGLRKVAEALRASDRTAGCQLPPRGADQLLEGLAATCTHGYGAGAPVLNKPSGRWARPMSIPRRHCDGCPSRAKCPMTSGTTRACTRSRQSWLT